MALKNLTGLQFGRLAVVARHVNSPAGKARWVCRCSCGTEKIVTGGNILSGKIVSCGCHKREIASERARERSTKHGNAKRGAVTGEYYSYTAMMNRCTNPNSGDYRLYGARGIEVCNRWRFGDGDLSGFECFLIDMGPRPNGHSLDRWPDNTGDYRPGNCRWATPKQQIDNRVLNSAGVRR
jgi:hypothetical protein